MAESVARHRSRVAQRGWTQCENVYLFDPTISAGALRLYMALRHYSWQNDGRIPTQVEIAAAIGTTDRSVRDDFRELERRGLVTVERRQGTYSTVHIESPEDSSGEAGTAAPEDSSGEQRKNLPQLTGPLAAGATEQGKTKKTAEAKASALAPIYEALVAAIYPAGAKLTPREQRKVALAAQEILKADGTPEQVADAARRYRAHPVYGQVAITAQALAAHWGEFAVQAEARARAATCPECEMGGGLHLADCSRRPAA